jgi:hypothetical protein
VHRLVVVVTVAAGVVAAGCAAQPDHPERPAVAAATVVDPASGAPAYDRDKDFGRGWAIVRGHCDTREVILERDAGLAAVDTDNDGCRDDGPVVDLYTGNTITPPQTQIDHVYSLKQAWVSGAWKWSLTQRVIFAQDQSNLRAVTGAVNERKGDLGPSQWRPPAQSGWCGYQLIYRATAQRWALPITPDDDAALRDMASTCPR